MALVLLDGIRKAFHIEELGAHVAGIAMLKSAGCPFADILFVTAVVGRRSEQCVTHTD